MSFASQYSPLGESSTKLFQKQATLPLQIGADTANPGGLGVSDEGALFYNTNTNSLLVWNGSAWASAGAASLQDAYDGGSDILLAANTPIQIRNAGIPYGASQVGLILDSTGGFGEIMMKSAGGIGYTYGNGTKVVADTAITFPSATTIEFGIDLVANNVIVPGVNNGATASAIIVIKNTNNSPTDEGLYLVTSVSNGTTTNSVASVLSLITFAPPAFTAASGTAVIFNNVAAIGDGSGVQGIGFFLSGNSYWRSGGSPLWSAGQDFARIQNDGGEYGNVLKVENQPVGSLGYGGLTNAVAFFRNIDNSGAANVPVLRIDQYAAAQALRMDLYTGATGIEFTENATSVVTGISFALANSGSVGIEGTAAGGAVALDIGTEVTSGAGQISLYGIRGDDSAAPLLFSHLLATATFPILKFQHDGTGADFEFTLRTADPTGTGYTQGQMFYNQTDARVKVNDGTNTQQLAWISDIQSFDATGAGTSNGVSIFSGATVNGSSGSVSLATGATSGSGGSGTLTITTGSTGGAGNSGSIQLSTGTSTSGAQGTVDIISSRFNQSLGTATAANDLIPSADGNTFLVSGNTQINAITIGSFLPGAHICLIFSGTPTVKHNTAGGAGTARIFLAGSVDLVAAANTVLGLVYDGTQFQETYRKVA